MARKRGTINYTLIDCYAPCTTSNVKRYIRVSLTIQKNRIGALEQTKRMITSEALDFSLKLEVDAPYERRV